MIAQHASSTSPWEAHASFFEPTLALGATFGVWLASNAAPDELRRLAQRRLDRLVEIARQGAPFYRRLYAGLSSGPVRLGELPVVSKRDLMDDFDATLTDPEINGERVGRFLSDPERVGQPLAGRYAVWTSSGSTGEPGIFVHDSHALAVYEALQVIRFRRLDTPALLAAAAMARERYAFVGATGGHFAGHAAVLRLRRLYPWLTDCLQVFSILEPRSALIARLNEYQPALLATYPTAAVLLAEAQRTGHLAIRPREIWTGGEGLTGAQKRSIAEAFGCVVRDDYGASEFLSIAGGCDHGALHVNADWVMLEPVDARYRPVPPGQASHTVLLTNLANHVQPLIRYDLGDRVTLLEQPCPCGSQLPAIRVDGRSDDVLTLRNGAGNAVTLLPLALSTILEDDADVFRFQLIQSGPAALRLRLDPHLPLAVEGRCRKALGGYLGTQGLGNVAIEIERATPEAHPVSGKLRRIVAAPASQGRAAHLDGPRGSRGNLGKERQSVDRGYAT